MSSALAQSCRCCKRFRIVSNIIFIASASNHYFRIQFHYRKIGRDEREQTFRAARGALVIFFDPAVGWAEIDHIALTSSNIGFYRKLAAILGVRSPLFLAGQEVMAGVI